MCAELTAEASRLGADATDVRLRDEAKAVYAPLFATLPVPHTVLRFAVAHAVLRFADACRTTLHTAYACGSELPASQAETACMAVRMAANDSAARRRLGTCLQELHCGQ